MISKKVEFLEIKNGRGVITTNLLIPKWAKFIEDNSGKYRIYYRRGENYYIEKIN